MALIFVVMLVIATTLLGLLGPYYIGVIIDEYIIPRDLHGTVKMCILLTAIYSVTVFLTWYANLYDGECCIKNNSKNTPRSF